MEAGRIHCGGWLMLRYYFRGFKNFMIALKKARILNLLGHMGTGKTLFATALGYHALRQGYVTRSAFNYPVAFGSAPVQRNCYAVLDEAGRVFDNRLSFKDSGLTKLVADLTYKLRKDGSFIVVPSFINVDKRLRDGVRMHRTWALGAYLWIYHWEIGEENVEERREGINYEEGVLWFFNPKAFFGVYDTYFQPSQNLSKAFLGGLLGDAPPMPSHIELPETEWTTDGILDSRYTKKR